MKAPLSVKMPVTVKALLAINSGELSQIVFNFPNDLLKSLYLKSMQQIVPVCGAQDIDAPQPAITVMMPDED